MKVYDHIQLDYIYLFTGKKINNRVEDIQVIDGTDLWGQQTNNLNFTPKLVRITLAFCWNPYKVINNDVTESYAQTPNM